MRGVLPGVCGLALVTLVSGCPRPASRPPTVAPEFSQSAGAAGISFHYEDGSSGRHYFAEVMGSGCALVDLTGDGLPDVYLVNGARLPGAVPGPPFRDAFYRNNGDGTFSDATRNSGLGDERYGIGCCAGDTDNDGNVDLYVTNLGRNTLYHNNGDGTFTDVTARAGVPGGGFSTGAAFVDYDGDGSLDLFVCRYVDWTPERDAPCTTYEGSRKVRVYCRPSVYPPMESILYRNNGNGTFTNVTRRAGLGGKRGRSLGCVWCDVDSDGDPDLFVANDMSANFLFINDGSGHFTEEGLSRGVALDENGRPQASMGVAAVDYDGDGLFDLACTNFSGEYLALYRNLGGGRFEDASSRSGVAQATSPYVGFGVGFPDLNLDGFPDLFVGNGHVTEAAERFYPGVSFAQPSLCLLNDGTGAYAPAPNPGPDVTTPRVSRGAAFGDTNGDGAPDVLVNNWRGTPDLLRNQFVGRGQWLRLSLVGTRSNRSAIGARVEVTAGGRKQVQEVRSGGSYCSQSELVLTFGLGSAAEAETIAVRWPGGGADTWRHVPPGTTKIVREGRRNSPRARSTVHPVSAR